MSEPEVPMDGFTEPTGQQQALQVLTLAQRTAEDHVATARRKADAIIADARSNAEQVVRDAHTHVQVMQQEAEKALTDARTTAAQIGREAQAQAEHARRNADNMLSDARTQADELAKEAQGNADELMGRAQQRYDDVVGGLAARREGLQRQIEALEQFDREYRARLTAFMQGQLRALWVEEPHVEKADLLDQPAAETEDAVPSTVDDSTQQAPVVERKKS